MLVIPTWFVAFIALCTSIIILLHDESIRVPIKVFALSSALQFIIYVTYTIFELTPESRQFITRSGVITMCLAISIILLAARTKNGH